MAKVKVYNVTVYNISTDEKTVSPRMATREGAALMGANVLVLEDTEVEIDESRLEPGEQWTPRDFRP